MMVKTKSSTILTTVPIIKDKLILLNYPHESKWKDIIFKNAIVDARAAQER